MSSITGLISGGGGGGASHILTDPQKMAKLMYGGNTISLKNSFTGSYTTSSADFWSNLDSDPSIYINLIGANNTYVTLADITSATNGGYLWWVISPLMDNTSNPSSSIRITVDGGTPVEITSGSGTYTGGSRFVLGSGIVGGDPIVSTTPNGYFSNYTTNAYYPNVADKLNDYSNGINNGGFKGYVADNIAGIMTSTFERLYFESSIKVEAKQELYFSASQGRYSACNITLL